MGLILLKTLFWICGSLFGSLLNIRGHIPDHAVRSSSPVAVPVSAIAGVLAAAALSIAFVAAALWATVWLAIRLI